MEKEFKWISYYRDLLIKAVPENTSSISQCVLKRWLYGLGNYLGFNSMRIYLNDDKSDKLFVCQVYGDKELWRDIDITKLRQEKTKYKKLYFVKIRHIRENGQFLLLGYLAFHTDNKVSKELLSSLDVLCMLYGNYILKRLIAGQDSKINKNLNKAYSVAALRDLPGTKIQKLLDCLHKLAVFNYGLYCTLSEKTIFAEYIASNKGSTFLRRHYPWQVTNNFIENLGKKPNDSWFRLADMPRKMIDFFLYKDKRSPDNFSVQVIPIYVDRELIGLWMFVFSDNNPYIDSIVSRVIEGTMPLLKDSYRFLFQRRFNYMIVNPIFQNRDTRVDHDSVFVIMPFTQEWSKDIWEQVIKPAVKEIGMTPIRADDLYGQNIMEDVWQSILKASIIICDTTGRNPNVFYELGIAHTLGKKVLLLTQNIDDIPFDLQAYRHIEYTITIAGGYQLKETIKEHIKETLSSKDYGHD